ncbi:RagB/SusD family nutrient uptake outer membrane protein [Salegentibacter flavus]|uniref:SusD family protein n=1 Tax=Salegentibacter flavus TaxID=287099 RepID=A0A1I5ALP0_9FLAO|nr:RagB/SusD family nutrient uptake outer membrane protein [Salegentibacter flavus]SFN63260.1 SusD family protein [Salegentibacter flavus]
MKNYKYKVLIMAFVVAISSCTTDDLEPTLAQSKSVEQSVTKVDNLYSILKGIHSLMSGSGYYGQDVIITNEVRSDNTFSTGNSGRFTTESQFLYNNNSDLIWNNAYEVIANTNIIITADLENLEGDTDYGRHIQGQALTIRALAHFDLLREYGQQHTGSGNLGVPVITEYKGEDLFPSRNTIDEVKAAVYNDLETAFSMMDSQYDNTNVIVSKYVAKALEARVAVYFGDWPRAVTASEEVINSGLFSIIPADSYVSSWAADGGPNVMFELAATQTDNAGINGLAYMYQINEDGSGYGDVVATPEVLDIYEDSDVRLNIMDTEGEFIRNVGKYPDNVNFTSNIPLFRYEEVILNYAEALFETGGDALIQLNKIPANRGASLYSEATKENILLERRRELIFEGFRFDDMLRTGMNMEAIGTNGVVVEVIDYPSYVFAWPIPLSEMNANSNMVQNDGY